MSTHLEHHPVVLQSGAVEHVETYGYFTLCSAGSLTGKMGIRPLGSELTARRRNVRIACTPEQTNRGVA
jgi:hypothetical protein